MVVAAPPPSLWDVPAITQPQGATEEFSDTLSPTREQMTPHTGAVNKKRPFSLSLSDAKIAHLYLPVPNTTSQHNELNIHGNTQLNCHDSTSSRRYSR